MKQPIQDSGRLHKTTNTLCSLKNMKCEADWCYGEEALTTQRWDIKPLIHSSHGNHPWAPPSYSGGYLPYFSGHGALTLIYRACFCLTRKNSSWPSSLEQQPNGQSDGSNLALQRRHDLCLVSWGTPTIWAFLISSSWMLLGLLSMLPISGMGMTLHPLDNFVRQLPNASTFDQVVVFGISKQRAIFP